MQQATTGHSEYRLWGRIERIPGGEAFRAIASVAPDVPGLGPDPDDLRVATVPTLEESRIALGRMLYELTGEVKKRGGDVSWMDVR